MTDAEKAAARARIAVIDSWFADATGWGSWMVEMSNERRALVDRLRTAGEADEHRHVARTASGGRVD
jgi:hypothetical protein